MRDEPESARSFQCGVSLKTEAAPRLVGCYGQLLSLVGNFGASARRARACGCFGVQRTITRCRRGGNVGIAVCAISKGLWEAWKTCRLVFHGFHGPVISTALLGLAWRCAHVSHFSDRQRDSSASLAFCIRLAASVSLIRLASRSRCCGLMPSFRCFCQSFSDVSFSYGVR